MQTIQYSRAPVIEAVIDIQARFKNEPSQERLDLIYAKIADAFPGKLLLHNFAIRVEANTEGAMSATTPPTFSGYRLTSKTSDRVLKLHPKGITLSHMAPYSQWEVFKSEAIELWSVVSATLEPDNISRYAVRFINRLVLPSDRIELEDYFELYPKLPEGIPQDINGMFVQLKMPQADLPPNSEAIINMGLADVEEPDSVAIMLDLDVFCVPNELITGDELWNGLEELRVRKNKLFEACITEKTRKLIK